MEKVRPKPVTQNLLIPLKWRGQRSPSEKSFFGAIGSELCIHQKSLILFLKIGLLSTATCWNISSITSPHPLLHKILAARIFPTQLMRLQTTHTPVTLRTWHEKRTFMYLSFRFSSVATGMKEPVVWGLSGLWKSKHRHTILLAY